MTTLTAARKVRLTRRLFRFQPGKSTFGLPPPALPRGRLRRPRRPARGGGGARNDTRALGIGLSRRPQVRGEGGRGGVERGGIVGGPGDRKVEALRPEDLVTAPGGRGGLFRPRLALGAPGIPE